ncbi:hypothetical protein G7046_g9543 [Stylonectria norvegica]|nr:hypothetical protein G7046_g9543 [Stylonectria norvegica]
MLSDWEHDVKMLSLASTDAGALVPCRAMRLGAVLVAVAVAVAVAATVEAVFASAVTCQWERKRKTQIHTMQEATFPPMEKNKSSRVSEAVSWCNAERALRRPRGGKCHMRSTTRGGLDAAATAANRTRHQSSERKQCSPPHCHIPWIHCGTHYGTSKAPVRGPLVASRLSAAPRPPAVAPLQGSRSGFQLGPLNLEDSGA